MTATRYTKIYATPGQCTTAAGNHAWLKRYTPLRLPDLVCTADRALTFGYVDGRHAHPTDLPRLAQHLGDAHGAAWANTLRNARLDRDHDGSHFAVLADFASRRHTAIITRASSGYLSDAASSTAHALIDDCLREPATFYKDTNPRNLLITADTVTNVDVDQLTLAPFGYDLAKLITGLHMTHGPLDTATISDALHRYNQATARHGPDLTTTRRRLHQFIALHAVFTAPYLGRNGYRHAPPTSLLEPA